MKKQLLKLLCAVPILGVTACCSTSQIGTHAVQELDLNRYAGQWYEIARFDHRFERGMVGCKAEYILQDDGTIKVVNTGYKDGFDGKFKTSVGKARRPDDREPGRLEVSFFGPFYSEYNVLALADDYSYSLVGSKKDKYLWILSRTPQLDEEVLADIVQKAQSLGYDTDKLIWVEQKKR